MRKNTRFHHINNIIIIIVGFESHLYMDVCIYKRMALFVSVDKNEMGKKQRTEIRIACVSAALYIAELHAHSIQTKYTS